MDKIREFITKYKLQVICILGGFVLYILASVIVGDDSYLIEGNKLARKDYGKTSTKYELYVSGLTDQEESIEIPVSAKEYKTDEIDDIFDNCMTYIVSNIKGDNPSLQEVYNNLQLVSSVPTYGVDVSWRSKNVDIISSYGVLIGDDITKSTDAIMEATLSTGKHKATYDIPITIIPEPISDKDRLIKDFVDKIKDIDKDQVTKENIILPTEYDGKSIGYRAKEAGNYHILWILGIVSAVLFYMRDKLKDKNKLDERAKSLQKDYPEIVSKLIVFIGAGMAVRPAWGQIAADYEKAVHNGEMPRKDAYEEMLYAYRQLRSGINEGSVYREFGKRCGSRQYMKFAGLLEQNRKMGVGNMQSILDMEMIEAWEERKNLARRMGEEASTKLLLPLILMLGIVMVIIMVPALTTFV